MSNHAPTFDCPCTQLRLTAVPPQSSPNLLATDCGSLLHRAVRRLRSSELVLLRLRDLQPRDRRDHRRQLLARPRSRGVRRSPCCLLLPAPRRLAPRAPDTLNPEIAVCGLYQERRNSRDRLRGSQTAGMHLATLMQVCHGGCSMYIGIGKILA